MKRSLTIFSYLLIGLLFAAFGWTQDAPIRVDFSGATAEENGVTITGAGFGSIPAVDVTFGDIPTDNTFEGATDGHGVIIQADPGEGVMINPSIVTTENAALIRCSVRADGPHASIYLASIEQGGNTFVSTITPNNGAFFQDRYRRISDFFIPPSSGFQPIIQIVNTSETEPLIVYLDNFEIIDLGSDRINISINEIIGGPIDQEPTPVPTPTYPSPQKKIILKLPLDVLLPMVLIPAGSFLMGTPNTEQDRHPGEGPQHNVTISQSFYMGQSEITQAQWKAVMSNNPSDFKGDDLPVESVSWNDCQQFLTKLNDMILSGKVTYVEPGVSGGTFRLPTEAEWEYSCRAGTTTRFYWGDDTSYTEIDKYAWHFYNSSEKTNGVGQKIPNPWELYDMNGNVREWCQDWNTDSYLTYDQVDPTGPLSGTFRVVRGGSWALHSDWLRSGNRSSGQPWHRINYIGFRVVRAP